MAIDLKKRTASVKKGPELKLTSSEDMPFWARFRMAIIAPPAEGKTYLGLTASAKLETGVLDDIVVVQTDPLGLAGAYEKGLVVPRVIDMSDYTDEDMNRVFQSLPGFIGAEVAKAPTRAVIIDTASVLFGAVCVTCVTNNDGPKAYNEFAREIRRFYSKSKAIPVPIIATMHVKPPKVIMDKAGTYIADSATAAGIRAGALTMDIEGNKGANVIRGMNTLTGRLRKNNVGGKVTREIDFESTSDETKRRFVDCLDKKEPADLGHIFGKIAEGCKQPLPGVK